MQKHKSSDFDLRLMPKLNAEAGVDAPVTVRGVEDRVQDGG